MNNKTEAVRRLFLCLAFFVPIVYSGSVIYMLIDLFLGAGKRLSKIFDMLAESPQAREGFILEAVIIPLCLFALFWLLSKAAVYIGKSFQTAE